MNEGHGTQPAARVHGQGSRPRSRRASSRWSQFYDCVAQLEPPLTFAKMATIATADSMLKNVPATVARLTGGGAMSLRRLPAKAAGRAAVWPRRQWHRDAPALQEPTRRRPRGWRRSLLR